MSLLIKDTTREERAKIVAQSLGNGCGSCDGCGACGSADMYDDYIEGRKELAQINAEYRARLMPSTGPATFPTQGRSAYRTAAARRGTEKRETGHVQSLPQSAKYETALRMI